MTNLFSLLSVLFIYLKVTGQTDWSWGWLILPLAGVAACSTTWLALQSALHRRNGTLR